MSPNDQQPVIAALTADSGCKVKASKNLKELKLTLVGELVYLFPTIHSLISVGHQNRIKEKTTRALSFDDFVKLGLSSFERPVHNLWNKFCAQYFTTARNKKITKRETLDPVCIVGSVLLFLDTQVSLEPTHVSPSVRWSY